MNKVLLNVFDENRNRFIALNNYENSHGEVSNYTIQLNTNYVNKVHKDIAKLEVLKCESEIAEKARISLLNSLQKNLNPETASAQSKAQKNAYYHVDKNVKINKTNGDIYINGMLIQKTVLINGVYPEVNSRPLTIEKNKIKKELLTSKYRQFFLRGIPELHMNGKVIKNRWLQ